MLLSPPKRNNIGGHMKWQACMDGQSMIDFRLIDHDAMWETMSYDIFQFKNILPCYNLAWLQSALLYAGHSDYIAPIPAFKEHFSTSAVHKYYVYQQCTSSFIFTYWLYDAKWETWQYMFQHIIPNYKNHTYIKRALSSHIISSSIWELFIVKF